MQVDNFRRYLMHNSLFFVDDKKLFPISLLAVEVYIQRVQSLVSDSEGLPCIIEVLQNFCSVKKPTEEDVDFFLTTISNIFEEEKNLPQPDKRRKCPTFGSSYAKYLQNLTVDHLLLLMTGYDFKKAQHLYCVTDRADVLAMVEVFMEGLLEQNLVQMEAAMYGFGGKYKNDKVGESKGIDISSPEGEAALKNLGF